MLNANNSAGPAFGRLVEFLEHLVRKGLSQPALERAERVAAESEEPVEVVLTRLGLLSERDFVSAVAEFLGIGVAEARELPDAPVMEERFSARFLKERQIIPLSNDGDALRVAFVNPLDQYAMDAARYAAKKPVTPKVIARSDFEAAYDRLYGDGTSTIREIAERAEPSRDESLSADVERLKDSASEAPVIRLVNLIIARGAEMRASDIHIEPMEGELRLRYRIDGVLHKGEAPPRELAGALISRVKIMAKLDIAERRLPQDGRIKLAVKGSDIDFRVSTTPTIHGESLVLRILDRGALVLDFAALGLEAELIATFRRLMSRPHGIFLVTGPTGSGKTTTLYTALQELNTAEKKILTIEDPVEYQLQGINQVQVKPQIGHGFASALRSFLRQDPDIMMVGEIRDLETAEIAVQAALTGHLILSTLHTNDAPSAITRLMDMGLDPYLLTSTINGIAAQRLVRMLCTMCREPYEASPALIEHLRLEGSGPSVMLHRANGCPACAGTGYHGRTLIMEVMSLSEPLRELVLRRASAGEIRRLAIDEGMVTMRRHGLKKAVRGITTLEEVARVTSVSHDELSL